MAFTCPAASHWSGLQSTITAPRASSTSMTLQAIHTPCVLDQYSTACPLPYRVWPPGGSPAPPCTARLKSSNVTRPVPLVSMALKRESAAACDPRIWTMAGRPAKSASSSSPRNPRPCTSASRNSRCSNAFSSGTLAAQSSPMNSSYDTSPPLLMPRTDTSRSMSASFHTPLRPCRSSFADIFPSLFTSSFTKVSFKPFNCAKFCLEATSASNAR
mmetsp:Transcript_71093/g.217896  ORF Transcript_71093/g.217896 Transcript_71093/m.217896 type:complete len:215 (+) Transcript_71093:306-950(+)